VHEACEPNAIVDFLDAEPLPAILRRMSGSVGSAHSGRFSAVAVERRLGVGRSRPILLPRGQALKNLNVLNKFDLLIGAIEDHFEIAPAGYDDFSDEGRAVVD